MCVLLCVSVCQCVSVWSVKKVTTHPWTKNWTPLDEQRNNWVPRKWVSVHADYRRIQKGTQKAALLFPTELIFSTSHQTVVRMQWKDPLIILHSFVFIALPLISCQALNTVDSQKPEASFKTSFSAKLINMLHAGLQNNGTSRSCLDQKKDVFSWVSSS